MPNKLRIPSLKIPEGDSRKENEAITRRLGDAWLKSRRSALARVPSAILPQTWNYLLNPLHPDTAKIKIGSPTTGILDPRLIR